MGSSAPITGYCVHLLHGLHTPTCIFLVPLTWHRRQHWHLQIYGTHDVKVFWDRRNVKAAAEMAKSRSKTSRNVQDPNLIPSIWLLKFINSLKMGNWWDKESPAWIIDVVIDRFSVGLKFLQRVSVSGLDRQIVFTSPFSKEDITYQILKFGRKSPSIVPCWVIKPTILSFMKWFEVTLT